MAPFAPSNSSLPHPAAPHPPAAASPPHSAPAALLPLAAALNIIILLAFWFGAVSFLLLFGLGSDPVFSAGVSLILFSALLLSGFQLPAILSSRFASSVESDLPMALRAMSLHLKIKLPFEKALSHAATGGYASSPLWAEALHAIHSGQSVPQALSHVSEHINSLPFLRAAQALSIAYEEGGSPETLDALADELTAQQMAQLRVHSSRAGLVSLLLIASSCLLPAFFLILTVTAGPLLDFHPDAWSIGLFYIVILPGLNLLVLGAMIFSAPSMSGSWRPARLREEVAARLRSRGWPVPSFRSLVGLSIIIGLFALVPALLLGAPPLLLTLSLALAILPLLAYTLLEGQVYSDLASAEAELPHLLLSGASIHRFSLDKMLEQARRSPSPSLARWAGESLRLLQAGANPVSVLSDWSERTPSILISRALRLLQVGYQTGGNLSKALRETAGDLLSSFTLVRERAALLSVQRYTLLAAAGLLVPAILGLSLAFSVQVQSIGLPMGAAAGINDTLSTSSAPGYAPSSDSSSGLPPASPSSSQPAISSSPLPFGTGSSPSVLHAAALAISIYLLINALLTAFFLAISQGARERFVPYAALLVLLSQAVWLLLSPAL